jgi:hypothetical protein
MLLASLVEFDSIRLDEANACLVAWKHRMGPFRRPDFGGKARAHGLRHHGELVAITIADRAISEHVAGIRREDVIELARVCAVRRNLNRVVVRLWREFVLPPMAREWGASWAVSYQHATMHSGDLYRFDGWQQLGRSSSGTDKRSGRRGYSKVIWGWPVVVGEG